jgi:DNA-binding Lrp family transcriptional regulator
MITERDKEIIRLINRFGYLTAAQVAKLMKMSRRVTYRRLQKLVEDRYLIHTRVLSGKAGIYRATTRGLGEADAELGRAVVRLLTLEHNLAVADVAAVLMEKHHGAAWTTERELRREAGQKFGVGWQGHVPDGVLTLSGGEKIAVEYENTTKTKTALNRVLRAYLRQSQYQEVWFVCRTRRQAERLKEATKRYDFVKIFEFKGVVQDEAVAYKVPVAAVLPAGAAGGTAAAGDAGGACGL